MRFLKVLAWLISLLVVGVALMWALGSRLPHDHTATVSELLAAPQEKVWALITDVPSQPSWRSGLHSVEELPPQHGYPCWRETSSMGKMPLCEVMSEKPNKRVVQIADPDLPYGGKWIYTLETTAPNQTRITITEDGTTGPAIWRFVGHYVFHEDTQIKRYAESLQQAVTK
jgi:hypothetical protein